MEHVEALFDNIDGAADSGPSRELRLWTFVDDTATECVATLDGMIRAGAVNRDASVAVYRSMVDLHAKMRAAFLVGVEGRTKLPAEDAADLALLENVVAVLRRLVTERAAL